MGTERVVLCGGVKPSRLSVKDPLLLEVSGPEPNVFLRISALKDQIGAGIPDVLVDLLEIAAYVYAADQAASRGGQGVLDYGARWRRQFSFHVPVRKRELWRQPDVLSALQDALGFLTEDEYNFQFVPHRNPSQSEGYLELGSGGATLFPPEEVILFSGGMDSLGGAVQESIIEKRRVVLVSHRSTPKTVTWQERLLEGLQERSGKSRLYHVPVWVNKSAELDAENTQRSRSFLYAALATTVARLFGLNRIRFYENGVMSLNLPISEQLIGTKASRTAHPLVLKKLARLMTLLMEQDFKIENPFLWETRADVINLIGDAGCADLIPLSRSCTRTRVSTSEHPHCGRCIQCVDRRISALSSRYGSYDPAAGYQVDVLRGAQQEGIDRTLVESYARTATETARMSDLEFFTRFPECYRVLTNLGIPPSEAAELLFSLHRRHALEVTGVLDRAISDHPQELREGTLPDSCLLVLALPERPRYGEKEVARAASSTSPERAGKARPLTHLTGQAIKFIEQNGAVCTQEVYHRFCTEIRPKGQKAWREGVDFPSFAQFRSWWSHSKAKPAKQGA